ncbi:MAG: hypothetical protein B6244_03955 [Candidatus Cloacimonetes bacterium 4572_55]|nr:MAG: hypothetical protein B6244_03955 [Candidatus Cloacimonetes bacterium 4572_55]
MAGQNMESTASGKETQVLEETKETLLDDIFDKLDIEKTADSFEIDNFSDPEAMVKNPNQTRIAQTKVLLDWISQIGEPLKRLDRSVLDDLISMIDQKLSSQLDEIIHHAEFQKLESSWRGLEFLVKRTDFRQGVIIEVLDVDKEELIESFEDAMDTTESELYDLVYNRALDRFGDHPYSSMISNFEFTKSAQDMALLRDVSKVAAAAHCPFIGSVNPKFFGVNSMDDLLKIKDINARLRTADYIKWNSFRESSDSRFVGLAFPRFMLRLPYGPETSKVKGFNYIEDVKAKDHDKYLWGNASFAFASNLTRAFVDDGWTIQIRGLESGGRVEDLCIHNYETSKGTQTKISTEVCISERMELELANLGFIPFVHEHAKDFATFYSASSTQKPQEYHNNPEANKNSKINARLPYLFLAARISHYLKTLQRRNIGSSKSGSVIQSELNEWLSAYVTKVPNPGPKEIAKYPLKEAKVTVVEKEDDPGYFTTDIFLRPHFQVEGLDISLKLVGDIPG